MRYHFEPNLLSADDGDVGTPWLTVNCYNNLTSWKCSLKAWSGSYELSCAPFLLPNGPSPSIKLIIVAMMPLHHCV